MRDILKHIPGFRSGKKPKMIIASIYYFICLTALTSSFWTFLAVITLPFVVFSAIDVFKNKSKKSILALLVSFIIMYIGAYNMPDTQTKKSNIASNTQVENTTPKKSTTPVKTTKKDTTPTKAQEIKSPIKLDKATVTRHVDGDTVYVKLENGQTAKVRLIGVNTPESTTKHEQYGEQASDYTKSQLFGKTVYLESDAGNTDTYGRLLRYVWLSPPKEINESEIRAKMFNAILAYNGYAEQMTIQPNVKYADYFRKFCAEARENSRGLWAINPNGTTKGDGISAPSSSNSASSSSSSNQNTSTATVQQQTSAQPSATNQSQTVYVTKTGKK
ncbi:thermonuclease family protein [Clostridium sp. HV4-5-A1G]|uniref:thermonuclease family protein n=1 Tax=Clostridium sp. HV4-5-A1G TaxID=2004595 RepID=UPI001F411CDD|nr:thermonuclease family protein [Clostridium sp. HV4-5-A1G]